MRANLVVFFFFKLDPEIFKRIPVGLKYLSDFGPYYDDIVSHLEGDKV